MGPNILDLSSLLHRDGTRNAVMYRALTSEGRVEGKRVPRMLIDTGAAATVVSLERLQLSARRLAEVRERISHELPLVHRHRLEGNLHRHCAIDFIPWRSPVARRCPCCPYQ